MPKLLCRRPWRTSNKVTCIASKTGHVLFFDKLVYSSLIIVFWHQIVWFVFKRYFNMHRGFIKCMYSKINPESSTIANTCRDLFFLLVLVNSQLEHRGWYKNKEIRIVPLNYNLFFQNTIKLNKHLPLNQLVLRIVPDCWVTHSKSW